MDIHGFEAFMKTLEWEVQKYTINQKMNSKDINAEDIIDIVIKCENKAKKKYFKDENNGRY